MKLVQFIENRFQELTLEIQSNQEYFVHKDAESKSLHQLLNSYRMFLKWFLIPKVLFNYLQVKIGWKDEPKPVLVLKAKTDQEARDLKAKTAAALIESGKVSNIIPDEKSIPGTPA